MSEIPTDLKEMLERLHNEGMELMAHFAIYNQLFNYRKKRYEIYISVSYGDLLHSECS